MDLRVSSLIPRREQGSVLPANQTQSTDNAENNVGQDGPPDPQILVPIMSVMPLVPNATGQGCEQVNNPHRNSQQLSSPHRTSSRRNKAAIRVKPLVFPPVASGGSSLISPGTPEKSSPVHQYTPVIIFETTPPSSSGQGITPNSSSLPRQIAISPRNESLPATPPPTPQTRQRNSLRGSDSHNASSSPRRST